MKSSENVLNLIAMPDPVQQFLWRPNDRLTLDIHARQREDMQKRLVEDPDQDSFDFFFRLTWSFDIKDSQTQIIHPPDTTDPGNGQENSRAETGAPSF